MLLLGAHSWLDDRIGSENVTLLIIGFFITFIYFTRIYRDWDGYKEIRGDKAIPYGRKGGKGRLANGNLDRWILALIAFLILFFVFDDVASRMVLFILLIIVGAVLYQKRIYRKWAIYKKLRGEKAIPYVEPEDDEEEEAEDETEN